MGAKERKRRIWKEEEEQKMRALLAIDPGKSGGFAMRYPNGAVVVYSMPDSESDVDGLIESVQRAADIEGYVVECVLERVGGFTGKGQPGSAMFTFGRGVGVIVGLLLAYKIPFREVTPQAWQKAVGAGTKNGRSQTQWKRHLLDMAKKRFPVVTGVTLKTADALLMLAYMEE